MDIKEYVIEKAQLSKNAARKMASIGTELKNKALLTLAEALLENSDFILSENKKDIENGKKNGITDAFLDRLLLNKRRIEEMSEGLKQVASLPDPIGDVTKMWKRPNGLSIGQIRVPLGVIGIIYEARPNVTLDAAVLCLKSGNSVILKGGSEAINSNCAITKVIQQSIVKSGLPEAAVQLIEVTDREAVNVMMKLNSYIDVIIPRGGAGLIQNVVQNSTVPVIQTGVGNCHIFVDSSADFKMAQDIIINAKVQRPAVCNAVETILIHKDIAETFVPSLVAALKEKKVEVRGDELTNNIASAASQEIKQATAEDWATEYDDLILAIRVVASLDEALDHIFKYGTKHSEAIITKDYDNSQRFLQEVDAAAVYINASTRFTDGFEFGFGAEIGISTQKLHARGPMGLTELTTTKYIIYGNGQIRK